MSALPMLIAFSFLVALAFLIAFLWSVKKGQYEDDYTPSVSMLFDEDLPIKDNNNTNKINQTDK